MDNVHVAIRVRPLIQREKHAEAEIHWKADTHTITQLDHKGKACRKEYVFDRVFDSSETTSDVYEEIAQPIVVEAMDGINGTIFAYGQTSSGKTHTMMGDRECPGIIPSAIQEIFDSIENTPKREFLLRVSYMELYNEGLCDLLSNEKKSLQIREVDKRVFVHDLTEEVVTEPQDVLQLLKKGEARRHFGQTDMNERSSRSHTIFRMIIESREIADRKKSIELAVRVSHLNLVDLAGSERANETKAEGTRLKEACRINQSLHQLAMVISKLSQGAEFIPFRDSKLTRILQMSLGGNAKTAIICTVTPASVDQTHSTLQFASRAKTIKNKPQVNEVLSDEAMMQRQKKEIQELKRKILELKQQGELLEEKASLHEQQEQRIKLLEKMILVSGGADIPNVMHDVETKKAKYKRRQTWCPGTGNPLPLLPISKPAVPAVTEEESFFSVPPSSATLSFTDGADTSPGSVSPVASVCSDDFSNTKQLKFMEDMEQLYNTEDSILTPLPLSPERMKRKRRRAHVHFSVPTMSQTADAECQTEVVNYDPVGHRKSEPHDQGLDIQHAEAEKREQEAEARIAALSQQVDNLTKLREEQHQEVATLNQQWSEAENQVQGSAATIATLSQEVDNLTKLLEEQHQEVANLNSHLDQQRSEAERQIQGSAATIAALSQQIQDLERKQAPVTDYGSPITSDKVDEITSDKVDEEAAITSVRKRERAEEKVNELTDLLRARQEEIETLTTFLEELGREAEEARCNHVARIAELTALVEEQQGQLAMTGVPQPSSSESGPELSLAAELGTQDWKAKARRTESELLGSVQLCEEIMEEKTKVSQQMKQLQAECSSLKNSVRDKVEELQALQELHEFTQIEVAVIKEQEVQYQSNIQDLEKRLRDQEDMLAAQHRHEVQELQKKLGTKDKVLETQYQQDIDELLHKLREKNQKFDTLQEQNASLVQALSKQEQLVERLQEQLCDLKRSSEVREDSSLKEQLFHKVPSDAARADEGTQTELRDCEALAEKVVDVSEEATRVSPENLRFFGNEAASLSEMVDADKQEAAFQPEILQQRIAELEAREEALRRDCDSLSLTISSRDQEIEVLNEILQDYGEEKESDTDSAAKIEAFVQRIEELEEKLRASASNQVPPCEADIQNSLTDRDLQAMPQEKKNLSNALTQTEKLCKDLEGTRENEVGDNTELSHLRKELQVLTESNLSLSEKLAAIEVYCGKLEEKVHVMENGEQQENSREVQALERQLHDMVSQKAEWDRTEDELNSKIKYFENCITKSRQENQINVMSEKKALHEERVSFKQQLQESSIKVQELETAMALLHTTSEEATKTIKNRDDELEMLRQVLGEQEQQLQTTRNDYTRSVSRIQQLEYQVKVMNQRSADHELKTNEEENEIRRLRSILEHQEEQLRTQESQNQDLLSKIHHLESALDANNKKNQEKSQAEKEHQDKLQRLQNCLEEQAHQLRFKNEMCTELEEKLQDSERVLTAMNLKSAEWEALKSKQEEEIQLLERELDDMGDEFSEHKNEYADLQAASRDQLARIKELEATIMKRDKEMKSLRALLDERNQKALSHKDKYYETKIQELKSVNSNQGLATAELKETIGKRDEELQQLYAALSNQEKEFQGHCLDLKKQLQMERELMGQMGKEMASVKHQLEEQKNEFLTEVSKKEEEFCTMQNALQEYRGKNESLKSEVKSLEAQVQQLMAELENMKASPSSSEVAKLEKEKNEVQSQLDKASKKLQRKTTELEGLAEIYEELKQTCFEVEDELEAEKAEHQQTKMKIQELEISKARLEELEKKNLTVEELVKTHRQKLAEKNLRINELETDLLRGTDPLEEKIQSLRSEVRYQENKAQQYKKEMEKLRTQAPKQERAPEATGGSGIIESCAIFAIKAENHKLTKTLEKTNRELEHKDLMYHDQVTKRTEAEHEARYWKEKARSMASHLKRPPPPSHPTDNVTASILKERDTNSPSKKSKTSEQVGTKYIEKIPGLHRATRAGAPSQRDDRNWLTNAVAERDAEEAGKGDDDPQQCATQ